MAEIGIIASVIQIVGLGTRLSLGLYKFGVTMSSATQDVTRVANGVNLFCLMLRQVGTTLEEDTIHSPEAVETVQEIVQQCRHVFDEIGKMLAKFKSLGDDSKGPHIVDKWKWSIYKPKSTIFWDILTLLNHSVDKMLRLCDRRQQQTSSSGMAEKNSRVAEERLQMESLIIEQQLSVIKTGQLFEAYQNDRSAAVALEQGDQDPEQLALKLHSEFTKCVGFTLFQEPSCALGTIDASPTDVECLTLVLRHSNGYIDYLLARWTRLREIEERIRLKVEQPLNENALSKPVPTRLLSQGGYGQRSRGQSARVESDDSEDEAAPAYQEAPWIGPDAETLGAYRAYPPHELAAHSPRDEPRGGVPIPTLSSTPRISIPNSQPKMPPKSPSYLSPNPSRLPASPPLSPLAPGNVYSRSAPFESHVRPDGFESAELGIPWRLRLHTIYWDFLDSKVVASNTEYPPIEAWRDRDTRTEIRSSWVGKEAIEEAGYRYNVHELGESSEICYSIYGALNLAQVEKLIQRTVSIYRQKTASASEAHPQPPHQTASYTYKPDHYTAARPPPQYIDTRSSPRSSTIRFATSPTSQQNDYADASRDRDRDRDRDRKYASSEDAHRKRRHSSGAQDKGKGRSSTVATLGKIGGIAALLEGLDSL
ncbi:hypothetical protein LTR60_001843 [Cryomyces antarcticus]|nr:hypothetical protein LTR60_001843 [Cryomyces antarcticus]